MAVKQSINLGLEIPTIKWLLCNPNLIIYALAMTVHYKN
jgi:hypothetical protein